VAELSRVLTLPPLGNAVAEGMNGPDREVVTNTFAASPLSLRLHESIKTFCRSFVTATLVVVHASKTRSSYDREARLDWSQVYGVELPKWEELVVGAIVGVVELVDCLPVSRVEPSPWVEGRICWVLSNPRSFADPALYRGAQGLFDVPDALIATEFNFSTRENG
jgi:hypothetical protein